MELSRYGLERLGPPRRGQAGEGPVDARQRGERERGRAHLDARGTRFRSTRDEKWLSLRGCTLEAIGCAQVEAPVPAQRPGELVLRRPPLVIEIEPERPMQ